MLPTLPSQQVVSPVALLKFLLAKSLLISLLESNLFPTGKWSRTIYMDNKSKLTVSLSDGKLNMLEHFVSKMYLGTWMLAYGINLFTYLPLLTIQCVTGGLRASELIAPFSPFLLFEPRFSMQHGDSGW